MLECLCGCYPAYVRERGRNTCLKTCLQGWQQRGTVKVGLTLPMAPLARVFECVCVCVCVRTKTNWCTYSMCDYLCVFMRNVKASACQDVHAHIHACVWTSVCMCVCVCLCVCMCVCVVSGCAPRIPLAFATPLTFKAAAWRSLDKTITRRIRDSVSLKVRRRRYEKP